MTMVPLEVTHTALATPSVLSRMFSRNDQGSSSSSISPFKTLVKLLLTYFETTYREIFKFRTGAPLHDPCAVAAVIAPQLFEVSNHALAKQHDVCMPDCRPVLQIERCRQTVEQEQCTAGLSVDRLCAVHSALAVVLLEWSLEVVICQCLINLGRKSTLLTTYPPVCSAEHSCPKGHCLLGYASFFLQVMCCATTASAFALLH